jgi:hypothetical protein
MLTAIRGQLTLVEHARFTADTGVPVYFCDPRSPWQRASNENANGSCANTCPGRWICASSARPTWTGSPLSSTAALDRSSASRHPHKHSRCCCPDL